MISLLILRALAWAGVVTLGIGLVLADRLADRLIQIARFIDSRSPW